MKIPPKPRTSDKGVAIPAKPDRGAAIKRVVVNVDPDLHADFKIGCIRHGTTIRAELVDFIERRLKEWGEK